MCNVEVPFGVEFIVLDQRLRRWGFPGRGSEHSAGVDLYACIDEPLEVRPQHPPTMISAGMRFRIGDPNWCALVLPRSGWGHKGLVLGNLVGVVDADFDGPCQLSIWNRNPASLPSLTIQPGDRVAQLVFTRAGMPQFREVQEFSARSPRGADGYGSTGG